MSSRPTGSAIKRSKVLCTRLCHEQLTYMTNGVSLSSHKIDSIIIFALSVAQRNMGIFKHSHKTQHFYKAIQLDKVPGKNYRNYTTRQGSRKEYKICKEECFASISSSDQDSEPVLHSPQMHLQDMIAKTSPGQWSGGGIAGEAHSFQMCVLF